MFFAKTSQKPSILAMGIIPSSLWLSQLFRHKRSIEGLICSKFEKLHIILSNEESPFICIPCGEALYKRHLFPECPVCFKPCMTFTINFYFFLVFMRKNKNAFRNNQTRIFSESRRKTILQKLLQRMPNMQIRNK